MNNQQIFTAPFRLPMLTAAQAPTILYFPLTGTPDITPDFDAFDNVNSMVRRLLVTDRIGTSVGTMLTKSWTAGQSAGFAQFISPRLRGSQIISGICKGQFLGAEDESSDNVNILWKSLRVFSEDGTVLRGTLFALASSSISELSKLGYSRRMWGGATSNFNLTPVDTVDGDRIVIEIGFSDNGSDPEASLIMGDDLSLPLSPEGSSNPITAPAEVPWIQFSQGINFK